MSARPGRPSLAQRRALLAHVRAHCENRPGTYRMLAESGRVLYVGKSRALRTRLLSYFRVKGRRRKSARIVGHAFAIEWSYANDEFGALLAELRQIKQLRPPFNRAMMDDEWPRAYIALTRGPVPGLRLVRRTDDLRASGLWGPFRLVSKVGDALRALADVTGVRDCTIDETVGAVRGRTLRFADDDVTTRQTVRTRTAGCLRVDVGTCAGPCIGQGTRAPYEHAVQTVRAFLEARDDAPVRRADAQMTEAATALAFERAAAWRDKRERLAWLWGRVTRFQASMDRLTFRYDVPPTHPDDPGRVYLVRRGTVRADVPAPRTVEEHAALTALAQRVFHGSDEHGDDVPRHDLDEFYLVASWFRRRPDERARTHRVLPAGAHAESAAPTVS
jgi:excinuclease ABC subunit C